MPNKAFKRAKTNSDNVCRPKHMNVSLVHIHPSTWRWNESKFIQKKPNSYTCHSKNQYEYQRDPQITQHGADGILKKLKCIPSAKKNIAIAKAAFVGVNATFWLHLRYPSPTSHFSIMPKIDTMSNSHHFNKKGSSNNVGVIVVIYWTSRLSNMHKTGLEISNLCGRQGLQLIFFL